MTNEFHEIGEEDFPLRAEFWAAGVDRRGEPTYSIEADGPGAVRIPGFGPGTWVRLTFGIGKARKIFIEPPPGEKVEDF